jgi:hypothetical protein
MSHEAERFWFKAGPRFDRWREPVVRSRLPGPFRRAEIFKWVDESSIVHYTTNRASIPVKFQDTVKIVETPPASPPPLMREDELPPLPGPGFGEEDLPSDLPPPLGGSSDVTGTLLQSEPARKAEPAPRTRTASIKPASPPSRPTGRARCWRAQFYRQQAVDRRRRSWTPAAAA